MIIAGVDPGSHKMGVCVLDVEAKTMKVLELTVLTAKSRLSRPERLGIIFQDLTKLLGKHLPQHVSVEQAYVRHASAALALGEARGIIFAAASRVGAKVSEFTPAETKQAVTGKGNADKSEVQAMVCALLRLSALPPEDAADAAAAAIAQAWALTATPVNTGA
jgi:crossover junction endodeoxyribonuclease RuvC